MSTSQPRAQPSIDSVYSDIDPSPDCITRRKPKPPICKRTCSLRLQAISEPSHRAIDGLYNHFGYLMTPQKQTRIRRKLDNVNLMTMEQLEEFIAARKKDQKLAKRHDVKNTFKEYSRKMICQLYNEFSKTIKQGIERRMKQSTCNTTDPKLVTFCENLIDSTEVDATAKYLVATELAMIVKRIFIATSPKTDPTNSQVGDKC